MKVLVCGGRNFDDYDYMKTVLSALQIERGAFTEIIHGDAPGADTLAGQYGKRQNIPVKQFPAKWVQYGDKAGPIRNKQMLVEGKPDLVIAFRGNFGTANMIRQARNAGVEVFDAGANR